MENISNSSNIQTPIKNEISTDNLSKIFGKQNSYKSDTEQVN